MKKYLFLMNKKEMYSNEYFHSFFYSFIRILGVFIGHYSYIYDIYIYIYIYIYISYICDIYS